MSGALESLAIGGGVGLLAGSSRTAYDAIYQINPLFLQGGSFAGMPRGLYPFTGLAGSLLGEVQGAVSSDEPYLGKWLPLPGAKMVSQSVATYPFASQQVAANATVQQPLTLSMLFVAPVHSSFGYMSKAAIFIAIQQALTQHNNAGGMYTIFTPSLFFQNGILLDVSDATSGDTKQVQVEWQFDFFFPLITQQAATAAFSSAMQKLAGGQPVAGLPQWQTLL